MADPILMSSLKTGLRLFIVTLFCSEIKQVDKFQLGLISFKFLSLQLPNVPHFYKTFVRFLRSVKPISDTEAAMFDTLLKI